ncbi:MAG: hypothetical protein MUC63_08670, partial [Planctomycetes bacterium]|nr:hypothetical protein [Planctomycetota bacterium]
MLRAFLYNLASAFLFLLGHALKQAGDRGMITPAAVFYERLQARRRSGELGEAEFRAEVDRLVEVEILWR